MARGYVFLVVMLSLIVGVSTTITKRSKKQPLCRNNMPYDPTKARLVVMNEPIIGKEVLCDTQNGWIYIQRRGYGNQSFYQLWSRYVFGFGDVYADHWLGLEAIHNLTYSGHADLVIRVVDNGRYYDLYVSGFKVKDAKHYYQMTYEMILGGSLSHEAFERSKSCYFTTKDEDHDTLGDLNCAKDNRGGWWYSDCGWMHLNGPLYRIKRSGWWNHRYIGMCVYNGNFVRWLTYAEMKIRLSC